MRKFLFAAGAVAAAIVLSAPARVVAETPADTLVIADKIDDIVSLDPAESFEFSGNDMLNNVYDTLVELDPENLGPLVPGLAESWSLADDGVTYTFKIREDAKFHSGNPVTAEDAAWSLQRAVILDKTPSFILTQFGFTAENVAEKITVSGEYELTIVTDKPYAPSFFYNCLTAVVASVVDKDTAMGHEADGDMGYGWLKTNTAGSGAYSLRAFKPQDSYILEANADYWRGAPALKRVFLRHVPEPATQRLLLEKGDVDLARKLTPVDIEGLEGNADVKVDDTVRGRIMYVALSQKVEPLNNPKVIEAFKYLIDYDGMASTFLKGQYKKHQAFLPEGFLGALTETPYSLDIEKAKGLLAEAGVGEFEVTIFVRNDQDRLEMAQAFQNTLAQAGITADLRTGTGKEILGEYRARKHDIYLGAWGPDYPDPHTNADTFARNPDNSDEGANTGILAWRNAWPATEVNDMTNAAVLEKDTAKREQMYLEIQRLHQTSSPFAPMFQLIEQVAMRSNVSGFNPGGSIHSAFYWKTTKE
ncbi:MAG: ABC transporter substrate-binding protein [Rhodobacteraceae bacterium]|nr:ABC transporter substrate-binding protein [Paracoccaceae bacterium]